MAIRGLLSSQWVAVAGRNFFFLRSLAEYKLKPACPQIQVFDATNPGKPLGPISVCRKVGRELNDRFVFTAAGECMFDLPLEEPDIRSGRKYLTQVKIGELVVQPGNQFFFTPKTEGGTK